MTFPSRGTPSFWKAYYALPVAVRALARKNYRLWLAEAFHPSLNFKKIRDQKWSARIGDHYRAVGEFAGEIFVWEWIGTHEDYNKRWT